MGKSVFDQPTEIDWVKAAILERKMTKKMEWANIAAKAKVSTDVLRKLVTTKHTDDWNPEIRRNVCRALGISMRVIISSAETEGYELG